METKKKSIKKALTWLVFDNILTWSVAYTFTGMLYLSLSIALVSNTFEIFVYYMHERLWSKKQ